MNNIVIKDNFLTNDEVKKAYNHLYKQEWVIVTDIDENPLVAVNKRKSFGRNLFVGTKEFEQDFVVKYFADKIRRLNLPGARELCKVYFNCVKPGEKFDFHKDQKGLSVLLYCNPVWKSWWGSGTQFENKIVRIKPGRAIFFEGQIPHRCIAPNRFMNDFGRLSMVFQYYR